nr:DUF1127 domain-containing protein [Halomonas socia]
MLHDNLITLFATWRRQAQRHRSRRRLQELDRHLLDDIGIDRRTALHEARKPFWKP